MTRRALYVLGTSGLAREMAQLAAAVDRAAGRWDFRGFIGASGEDLGRDLGWGRVAGDDDWLLSREESADLLVAIGHPQVRARVVERYVAAGSFGFPNVIHPTALLDPAQVTLGRGNAVTAGCILTCDIAVGDFNLLNWNLTVGHDARLGDCCVLNPSVNVSGYVTLGDRVLVGTGAQILEHLTVASDAIVGAGAVVTRDVPAGVTVVGVPAKVLERR